jgi:hypothetical protein
LLGLAAELGLSEPCDRFNKPDFESDLFFTPGGRPRGLFVDRLELEN